ncbi:hypothetical protein [Haemophilus haemolyticus]|uniref:hypothetical protein n=1 Tax=Haemophilus haemolyticus TaxID=726 RepID=UPI000E568903|nr:hypothetical protein [Haemophilus haemolyticus]DAQ73797.1 MAG TPA: hypothetical protein [Caudoviricetes sp.]
MKPSNPMQQLQQWKANNGKSNKLKNELVKSAVKNSSNLKFEETSKTQQETQGETKNKYQGKLYANPLAFKCSQLTRQFKLILDNNRKCLEVYPDDFHHKIKFRDELTDLVVRLKTGGKLFNEMVKAKGEKLNPNNQETIRNFNQANDYLIHKFGEVIAQINQLNIERVEGGKLQGGNNE